MLEVWPVLPGALEPGAWSDLALPAAVRGVALGVLLGLAVSVMLIGITALVARWPPRWPGVVPPRRRPRPPIRRFVVPPDDWTPDLDQFTAAELARLHRLRRAYRAGRHQPTPDRQG
jgi:hypothetical protein